MWELRAFLPWEQKFDVEHSLKDKSHSTTFKLEAKRSDLYIDLGNPCLGLKFRDIPTDPASSQQVLLELKIQTKHNKAVEKWKKCVETRISFEASRKLDLVIDVLSAQLASVQASLKSSDHSEHIQTHFFKKPIQKQIFLCSSLQKCIDILRSPNFVYADSLYETRKIRSRMQVPVVELLPPHLIRKKNNPSQIKNKFLVHPKGKSKKKHQHESPTNEATPRVVGFEQTEVEVLKDGQVLGKYQTIEFEGLKPKLLLTCLTSLDFPFQSCSFATQPGTSGSTLLSAPSLLGYPEFIQTVRSHNRQGKGN